MAQRLFDFAIATVGGAVLGMACAALCGLLFGALLGASHGDLCLVVRVLRPFALAGAVAGGLVGACGGLMGPELLAEEARFLVGRRNKPEGARDEQGPDAPVWEFRLVMQAGGTGLRAKAVPSRAAVARKPQGRRASPSRG